MTAIAVEPATMPALSPPTTPTLWGLTPTQIHDRLWAAFGVQVVRRHEQSEIVPGAELFLLSEPDTLVLFRPAQVLDDLYWLAPELLVLRVSDTRPQPYREEALVDGDRLLGFRRIYRESGVRATRLALTPDPEIARLWQNAPNVKAPWRWLRSQVPPEKRVVRSARARTYDEGDPAQVMECLHDLQKLWPRPDTTIPGIARPRDGLWTHASASVAESTRVIGPVWVGAGREIDTDQAIVGPAVLWDVPERRPEIPPVDLLDMEPAALAEVDSRTVRRRSVPGKRLFDVAFALCALLATLPLYPIVALAILLEDRGAILFGHTRESLGGREFSCWKFRSMRLDADEIKERLLEENQADGPQFFIENDPRVTRVGRIIRKLQIDELPQLVNVLLGDMSIVGPRPSPHSENQYCPAWREARLSVRPGLTGLWQVSRTRQAGLDFQEWIKFDLEYVENASWALDLGIILKTVKVVLAGLR